MNVADIISGHDADRTAIDSEAGPLTYGALRSLVGETAAGLVDRGVKPRDRVCLIADTEQAFVVGLMGTLAAGAIVVPLNPASPAPEAIRQLSSVAPVAILVGRSNLGHARAVAQGVASVRFVGTPAGLELDGAEQVAVRGAPYSPCEAAADDEAALLFTSGTSGDPRAASLSHGNLLASQKQLRDTYGSKLDADAKA
ncbi:MAG: acyl--CoA ligase, partial [Actinobacteria bacterium]|nr:acyl--CoA ligase [Actinomycetota bacterium]